MAGIVMDTATFAHPNATPRTLVVSAALVEAGAPLSDISRRLYRTKPDASCGCSASSSTDWRAPTTADRLVDADRRRHRRDRRRARRTRRASSTCSSQAEAAEVAILFKEAGAGDAGQRPDQARRRRCDGPDRGGSGVADMPGRPGRLDASSVEEARPPVLAEADRLVAALRALTWRARRSGPGSTASSSSPSRPARPRTTSSRSCGGWPPRSGSVTAGRSIRSRAACCRSSSATATRVVEYHLGDRKAYRATVCFGASSTTDDLEGELTPADGARADADRGRGGAPRAHRPDLAAAAGLQRDQGRRAPRVRDGPCRRDGRAGAARGHDPRPRPRRGTAPTPSGRSRCSTSRVRPARTCGRSRATSGRRRDPCRSAARDPAGPPGSPRRRLGSLRAASRRRS